MSDATPDRDHAVHVIARQLAERVAREGIVRPDDISNAITDHFGEDWSLSDANAGHSLSSDVLSAFIKLAPNATRHDEDQSWRQDPEAASENATSADHDSPR